MKKIMILLLVVTSWNTFACKGGSIKINDASVLSAESLRDPITGDRWLVQYDLAQGMDEYKTTDSDGNETHAVKILGQRFNKFGDLLSTSYLVKDLVSGEEAVVQLKTNKDENGHTARGIKKKLFTTLIVKGC
jgi:hypothetical protein